MVKHRNITYHKRDKRFQYFKSYNKKPYTKYFINIIDALCFKFIMILKLKSKRFEKDTQKIAVVRGWKNADIRVFEYTFDNFYNTTHCESCGCELIKGKGMGKNKKVLDHDHFSGYPRHVICHSCNVWRRGYDNRRMRLHLELYRYFHRI